MPMLHPPRHSDFIRTEVIAPLGPTVAQTARVLHVPRAALSTLGNVPASFSSEMAMWSEKAFSLKMDLLLRRQIPYDAAEARKWEGEIDVERYQSAHQ